MKQEELRKRLLLDRSSGYDRLAPGELERMEEYMGEFEENGTDHITVELK